VEELIFDISAARLERSEGDVAGEGIKGTGFVAWEEFMEHIPTVVDSMPKLRKLVIRSYQEPEIREFLNVHLPVAARMEWAERAEDKLIAYIWEAVGGSVLQWT
jgi:hypothetical protein